MIIREIKVCATCLHSCCVIKVYIHFVFVTCECSLNLLLRLPNSSCSFTKRKIKERDEEIRGTHLFEGVPSLISPSLAVPISIASPSFLYH